MQTITRPTALRGKLVSGLLALGLATASPAPARADALPAGATEGLEGTSWSEDTSLGGTVISDDLHTITCGGSAVGTLVARVVRESSTSRLAFYYRLWLDSGTSVTMRSVKALGFSDQTLDAEWRSDGVGTVWPYQAVREGGPGAEVAYFFINRLAAGDASRFFFARTLSTGSPATGGLVRFDAFIGNSSTEVACDDIATYKP